MTSLHKEFEEDFIDLNNKSTEIFLVTSVGYPEHRVKSIKDVIRSASNLIKIDSRIAPLIKYFLCSDVLFIIHKGLIVGKTIDKPILVFVADFVRKLCELLGEVRECYLDFAKKSDQDIYEAIKFWYQDSDLFGYSNLESRFLFRDIAIDYALKMNHPQLFFDYKHLISGIYSAIIYKSTAGEISTRKISELNKDLNKAFVKAFYNLAVSEIINAKISKRENAKDDFIVESINPILDIKFISNTVFENRTSFESMVPDTSGLKLLPGKSASIFDPLLINIPENFVLKNQEFTYIIPESRRYGKCNKCHASQLIVCPDCNGEMKKLCVDCSGGVIECVRCSGTGEEEYTEIFEKLVTSEDGLDLVSTKFQRIKTKPCATCSTKGKVKCQTCDGSTKIKCSLCSGQGNIKCKVCAGIGSLEFHQILYINRNCKCSEKRFSLCGKEFSVNLKNNNFTKIKSMNRISSIKKQLFENSSRNIPEDFLNAINENLDNEWFQTTESKPVFQQCDFFVSYTYEIQYTFLGFLGKAYWHPSLKSKAFLLKGLMEGVIQASANDINNKKYFPAAKKIIFAENIGKKNADCFEDFQVHYKKLSIFMKFLVYIARLFVNPDSIW